MCVPKFRLTCRQQYSRLNEICYIIEHCQDPQTKQRMDLPNLFNKVFQDITLITTRLLSRNNNIHNKEMNIYKLIPARSIGGNCRKDALNAGVGSNN